MPTASVEITYSFELFIDAVDAVGAGGPSLGGGGGGGGASRSSTTSSTRYLVRARIRYTCVAFDIDVAPGTTPPTDLRDQYEAQIGLQGWEVSPTMQLLRIAVDVGAGARETMMQSSVGPFMRYTVVCRAKHVSPYS